MYKILIMLIWAKLISMCSSMWSIIPSICEHESPSELVYSGIFHLHGSVDSKVFHWVCSYIRPWSSSYSFSLGNQQTPSKYIVLQLKCVSGFIILVDFEYWNILFGHRMIRRGCVLRRKYWTIQLLSACSTFWIFMYEDWFVYFASHMNEDLIYLKCCMYTVQRHVLCHLHVCSGGLIHSEHDTWQYIASEKLRKRSRHVIVG